MKRILLAGITGQVGQELQRTLSPLGEVIGVDRTSMDLTSADSIRALLRKAHPDAIVNAAAYTAVDKAETEREQAFAINAKAPQVMAEVARDIGAILLHTSTDYVFDGTQSTPYTEQDSTNPLSVYGQSKLAGEEEIRNICDRHIILRTAWVYGTYGKANFVKTMLRLMREREEVSVVSDQVGSPTWARDIAEAMAMLLSPWLQLPNNAEGLPPRPEVNSERQQAETPVVVPPGTYHFTSSGVASWYDFAVAIFEEGKQLGFPLNVQRIVPITTPEYPTPAKRPAYSVLSHQKISPVLGAPPPYWRQGLRQMLAELHSLNA